MPASAAQLSVSDRKTFCRILLARFIRQLNIEFGMKCNELAIKMGLELMGKEREKLERFRFPPSFWSESRLLFIVMAGYNDPFWLGNDLCERRTSNFKVLDILHTYYRWTHIQIRYSHPLSLSHSNWLRSPKSIHFVLNEAETAPAKKKQSTNNWHKFLLLIIPQITHSLLYLCWCIFKKAPEKKKQIIQKATEKSERKKRFEIFGRNEVDYYV